MVTVTELDELTVRRAQAGDRSAQEAFLRRYAGPLHSLVRRCGVVPAETDDLVHDLLGRLIAALPRFQTGGAATLTTWVFTIAQRFMIDVSRKRHLELVPMEAGLTVPDHAPGPHEVAESRELGVRIEAALSRLPVDQRRVFVLAQVHQRPLQEIAEAEGVPMGTVKSRLHRARAALFELLSSPTRVQGDPHAVAR
jgi:RNA polymerase sigma-70 factor (ECF subfamily)